MIYVRFIDSAARQVAECNGKFEELAPSCQNALINIAFAGQFIEIPELRQMSKTIKQYFQLSNTFQHLYNTWSNVDPDVMEHCKKIKLQRVSDKEIAEFYLGYMGRQGLSADPRVENKFNCNEYSDQIPQSYGNREFISPHETKMGQEKMNYEGAGKKEDGGYNGESGSKSQQFPGGNNSHKYQPMNPQGQKDQYADVLFSQPPNPFIENRKNNAFQGQENKNSQGEIDTGFNMNTGGTGGNQGGFDMNNDNNQKQGGYNYPNQQGQDQTGNLPPINEPANFGSVKPNPDSNNYADPFDQTPQNVGFGAPIGEGKNGGQKEDYDDFFKQLDDLRDL